MESKPDGRFVRVSVWIPQSQLCIMHTFMLSQRLDRNEKEEKNWKCNFNSGFEIRKIKHS